MASDHGEDVAVSSIGIYQFCIARVDAEKDSVSEWCQSLAVKANPSDAAGSRMAGTKARCDANRVSGAATPTIHMD